MSWKTSRPNWSKWRAEGRPLSGERRGLPRSKRYVHASRRGAVRRYGRGSRSDLPLEGARFDIKTGAVLGPPARREVRSYPVRVAGADVEIEV
jgi:hypothetical protein